MKSILVALWKRRWCRLLGIAFIVCALPLLHPFIRQSIFGPQIDGVPWCVWEDEVRMAAHPDQKRSWLFEKLEKIGLIQGREHIGLGLNRASTLPISLHLADDDDPSVRAIALVSMLQCQQKHEAECEPIFRRHLQDDDPRCRMLALTGAWQTSQDIKLKSIAVSMLNDRDEQVRQNAAWVLAEMAPLDPDLFIPLAELVDDPDIRVRYSVSHSMRYFGKRGVPMLRKALHDGDKNVRTTAIQSTARLGKDGQELIPILEAMRNDPEPSIRRGASHGLYVMDPQSDLPSRRQRWIESIFGDKLQADANAERSRHARSHRSERDTGSG